MVMTLRQVPDCEPELMFTDQELSFLRDYAAEKRMTPASGMPSAWWPISAGTRIASMIPSPDTKSCGTARPSAVLGHQVGFRAGQRQPLQHIQALDVTS